MDIERSVVDHMDGGRDAVHDEKFRHDVRENEDRPRRR